MALRSLAAIVYAICWLAGWSILLVVSAWVTAERRLRIRRSHITGGLNVAKRIICWTGGDKHAIRDLANTLRCYKIDARVERRWTLTVPADQADSARERIARLLDPVHYS